MIKHLVSIADAIAHFVGIESTIETLNVAELVMQLPAWRPGRYELGNFAKNIRKFSVQNEKGESLAFKKISKDSWLIPCKGSATIKLSYEYYANQADAGACYVDAELIYLNPVHCFMYVLGRMEEAHTLSFELPQHWEIACQLPQEHGKLMAPNFDMLADSPLFVSPNLQHHCFKVKETDFHFWFQGAKFPLVQKLEEDTRKYALWQEGLFGELPCTDYHFLYLLLPTAFRHGVEHLNSTVIAMGPHTDFEKEDFYHDFLAISSHELFHLWNIKRIRPKEMWPYDFTKENYSELGYVYEGVTTYYGDLTLWQCGVWDWERYRKSLSADITRHLNNEGRFNYSVAESSFDTWLDGYVNGVPGRKVSIYMEGLIAAFIADVMIIEASEGKNCLDDAMQLLYDRTWKVNIGYSKETYQMVLETTAGISFADYFSEVIEGRGKMEVWLTDALDKLGLSVEKQVDEAGLVKFSVVKLLEPTNLQKRFFGFWSQSH